MNEFPIAQPVAGGFISPALLSDADEYISLTTSGNEGGSDIISRCMPVEAALAGIEGSLVSLTMTEGPILSQKIRSSCCGPDDTRSVRKADDNGLTPGGLKHRSPLFETPKQSAALSQHLCGGSCVHERHPRLLGTRVLTQRSQAFTFSRFIKIVLGVRPTMVEAFQRIIGAADLFAKTISNPNMYGNYPKDPEVDFDDLPHFAHSLFAGLPTCALGLCSEGDFAR